MTQPDCTKACSANSKTATICTSEKQFVSSICRLGELDISSHLKPWSLYGVDRIYCDGFVSFSRHVPKKTSSPPT